MHLLKTEAHPDTPEKDLCSGAIYVHYSPSDTLLGMNTAQKLWLGFGLLITLLLASGTTTYYRVRSIEGKVEGLARARDLAEAARQLENNFLTYALDVRTFLQTGDTVARRNAVDGSAKMERQLGDLQRLATSGRVRELAARIGPKWHAYKALGQRMLATPNRQRTLQEHKELHALRVDLKRILDDELQAQAIGVYNARERNALDDVRTIVQFALLLLAVGLVVAVVTSITVGRTVIKGEREIAEQGERLRTTLASIGDAVISTDLQGRITNMNPVAAQLTGWKSSDALGRPLVEVFRIVNEDTHVEVESPLTKALTEGIVVGLANHTLLIAKDGTERPIDDSAAPIRCKDGEIVGAVLVFRDFTERRTTERTLRNSELRTSAIFRTALDCIITMDHEGMVVEFNPAAERTFGYRREDAVGKELAALIIPHKYREAHRKGMAHYLASGVGPVLNQRLELTALRADGSEFPTELAITRIPVDGPALFTAYLRDISARKDAESKLRQLAADLSEADRRKNEFLAMLAHELRNPLAPIYNAVHVLRSEHNDAATVRSVAEMLDRQVGQMVRLVDDLLDVSRVSRAKVELRKEQVDLADVVHHAEEAVRSSAHSVDRHLAITLPKEPIHLNGDPARLAQVIGNLLNNACKFTDKGGHIQLTAELENEQVVVRVKDNGIGIAPDQLGRIFDLFVQVDGSLERTTSGLGLGLTLVKNLVEMHGGTVEAHSDGIGHGAEFTVRLPILREAGQLQQGPEVAEVLPSKPRRILIVDDNKDSATSLAMLLQKSGNETFTAFDGQEAVETAEMVRPDLVFMDIGMPKLNGYEACRHIREKPWGKNMVLIALTGWGQTEDKQRSKDAGFNGHLVKPVDFGDLKKLLTANPKPQ